MKNMGKKRILVVVDAQVDFITGTLGNEEAVKAVPNIVEKIKNGKWDHIFLTMDTHGNDYLKTREGKKLKVPHCIKETDGWYIESSVMKAVKDTGVPYRIYKKNTFGMFDIADGMEYDLDEDIDINFEKDTLYVEFCGFCTDICVISNALILKANWYDWADIAVDSKCCAGTTPERHQAALDVMNSCQIDII